MTVYEELFVNQDLVESYAKGRPTYPHVLFELLASLTHQHERAWDVGTGNGQAAYAVAEHYKSVVATDVSEPQLMLGKKSDNITYAKMSATPESAAELERVVGPEGSVDLVTVATALHWFDLEKFYPIVRRVLRKPGGVFAAWSYCRKAVRVCPEFEDEIEGWMQKLKPYSAGAYRHMAEMPFPFEPVTGVEAGKGVEGSPLEIMMEKRTSFDEIILLMRSMSPVQTALDQGVDVLDDDARQALRKAWGPESVRNLMIPIYVLIGTVHPNNAS